MKAELLAMASLPEGFAARYDAVFQETDPALIKIAVIGLIEGTERLLSEARETLTERVPFTEATQGFYEELINHYNKIDHAAETVDPVTALYASSELMTEVRQVLTGTGVSGEGLPDLVAAYDSRDLRALAKAARDHQHKLVQLLTSHGTPIREFDSYQDLKRFLDGL